MKTALWLAVVVGALAGCGSRTHLTESHGKSYRDAFARQAANPNAGAKAKTPKGLDSQEASIISDSYRRGLAGKASQSDEQEQMLLVAPHARPSASSGSYMPPPSVPQK